MAYPVIQSVTDTDFATSVTSMAVNRPATTDSGDLILAFVHVRNAGTWSTVPTGWAAIPGLSQGGGGSVGKLDGFYWVSDGSDGGTATWVASTGTTAAWQVLRITGWHGTTVPEATTSSGDVSSANPPSETASWGGSEENLFIAVAGHSASSTSAWSASPSGYSTIALNGASSGGAAVCVAHGSKNVTGDTEDPGTFTVSGSNRWWAAATVVIRPTGSSTAIKTVLGLSKASVKTINGLAIASVKTFNGLA